MQQSPLIKEGHEVRSSRCVKVFFDAGPKKVLVIWEEVEADAEYA